MSGEDDYGFFKARKDTKTYLTKVFSFPSSAERIRNVRIVSSSSDSVLLGEIEGAMCLRVTGNARKTQVTALITQDDKKVKRLSLQTFKTRAANWIEAVEKEEFTFRADEFARLVRFLSEIEFIDLSNESSFQIEDISKGAGPKAIIDASDKWLVDKVGQMNEGERSALVQALQQSLTHEEINVLLGRRKGLQEFEDHMRLADWAETQWQDFFDREQWVFGYGLDYRIMRLFDREMTVGGGGTDNRDRPKVDFLMNFTDYSVLVEIKRPNTPIFKEGRSGYGRAGTWEFSPQFIGAVSQIAEQKAEWLHYAQSGEHYSKGGKALETRTRNAKSILVIGSRDEFASAGNAKSGHIMRDTFELFRSEHRTIDIITFDELLERARFITQSR